MLIANVVAHGAVHDPWKHTHLLSVFLVWSFYSYPLPSWNVKTPKHTSHFFTNCQALRSQPELFHYDPPQPWLILSDKAWCAQEVHNHKEGAVQWYETSAFPENDYACTGCLYLPRAVANLLEREREIEREAP